MADPEFDFLVFIGRLQPFHRGHQAVLDAALKKARHVIVLVGSVQRPRCPRNPWQFDEREAMVRSVLSDADNARTHVLPVMDALYNEDVWLATVQKTVAAVVAANHEHEHRDPSIGLVGCGKKGSSYYPKRFPQWSAVNVAELDGVNGGSLRRAIFSSSDSVPGDTALPRPVARQLETFVDTPAFTAVQRDAEFIATYRQQWAAAPYPPMFVTVDALVIQSGHLLVIERKSPPGQGLLAMPGGFVDPTEDIQTAMLRELKEETCIDVPRRVLADAIRAREVFDDPYRSARGRTITHAFFVHLPATTSLPDVSAADDAANAFWIPLAQLDPRRCFEDHYHIVQRMVGPIADSRPIKPTGGL